MIYVCSLYSNGLDLTEESHKQVLEERVDYTMAGVNELMTAGYVPFSPILHCHELSKRYTLPATYGFWQRLDRNYIDHCSEVFVLKMSDDHGNWRDSEGISDEIAYAESVGKKITYVDCSDYKLK